MSDVFILADAHQSGSFIITESNFFRSRDKVTIAGNESWLAFGTILGVSNVTGKYAAAPATSGDGSDVAVAILWEDTDTFNDVIAGVVARDADVFAGALSYHPTVNTPALQQEKWDQLAAIGINVRLQDNPEARAANEYRISLGY